MLPCPPPGDLLKSGIEPRSATLQVDSLPSEPPGKPKNTEVGSLSLLQGIFQNQESNWGLLHCRWILYQLSYQGSPDLSISSVQFSHSVVSDSLQSQGLQHARLLCPWDFPGKNTAVGCYFLLLFLTLTIAQLIKNLPAMQETLV